MALVTAVAQTPQMLDAINAAAASEDHDADSSHPPSVQAGSDSTRGRSAYGTTAMKGSGPEVGPGKGPTRDSSARGAGSAAAADRDATEGEEEVDEETGLMAWHQQGQQRQQGEQQKQQGERQQQPEHGSQKEKKRVSWKHGAQRKGLEEQQRQSHQPGKAVAGGMEEPRPRAARPPHHQVSQLLKRRQQVAAAAAPGEPIGIITMEDVIEELMQVRICV